MTPQQLDVLYMDFALRVAEESHAIRRKVGAVLVLENGTIVYGWNGTPNGFDNNCEYSHNEELVTKPEVIHAEVNVISKLVRTGGPSTKNSTLYITLSPCYSCSLLLKQAGIRRVVFIEQYRDSTPIEFLRKAGIAVEEYKTDINKSIAVCSKHNKGNEV